MIGVMLSIRPEFCAVIASGAKTVELRKSKPKKLKPPFRCYIYEANSRTSKPWVDPYGFLALHGRGAVIGEFICDNICVVDAEHEPALGYAIKGMPVDDFFDGIYLCAWDVLDYLSAGKDSPLEYQTGYGWHISDLVIYDEPKPIQAFLRSRGCDDMCMTCKHAELDAAENILRCENRMWRPPQSWCYVNGIAMRDELEEGAG